MARKDVDLVIRAKDEAAKVVDSITAAINEFVEAQADLNKSAGKTSSTLGALGVALKNLDKELSGIAVADKLAADLDKATAAGARLKAEFDETQKAARDLAAELQRAEFATERLTAKAQGAAQAQAKQAAILERQKGAQAALTASLAEATRERDKLVAQEARLNQSGEKQAARVEEIAGRYEKLQAEIAATTNPTKTLQNRLESVGTSLAKQSGKLDELRGKYDATQASIAVAGDRISELSAKLATVNAQVERQAGIVGKIATNYRELDAAAKSASRNQKGIADAADKTADVLARQGVQIERAESELLQLAAASGKADAAMSELAASSAASLEAAFAKSRQALRQTRMEFLESSKNAKELAAAIDIIGPPTREQVVALGRLKVATDQAEASYLAQSAGLQKLRAIMEQTGGTVTELAAKHQAFSAAQAETVAELNRIQAEAAQTVAAYDRLAVAADRASTQTRRVVTPGTVPPAKPVNDLADAYRKLYGESRQALSITQRLRGEVLSLVSAYGGIYGVISLLNRAVKAFQTLEAASSRLNVVFSGDTRKTSNELDFLRRTADRLGITFGELADEYGKFAVATQGTNLQGEQTRKIFTSVAEAGRVNKLTMEQMKGVFTALTQIVSKGKVQMEELRQQLGDRLPGAIQIMADALNVGTDELFEMVEAGEVGSDALIKFATELDKRFGSQLAAALKTTTTALGQFQNAAFQALITFGEAGFIESFTELLQDMTETLKSADFQAFASNVSKAFGVLIDTIGLAIQNFDLLVIAAAAFAGIKLTPLIVALAANFATFATNLQRVGTVMVATRNAMATTIATTTGLATATGLATTAMRGLTLAVRALISSTGIGLIVTAISVGIGYWATRADEATEALNRHQRIVDQVKNAYDKAGGAVKDWAKELRGVTVLQAETNLNDVIKAAKEARSALQGLAVGTGVAHLTGDARAQAEALRDLAREYEKTGGDVDDFKEKVQGIADAALDDSIKEYAINLLNAADGLRDTEKAVLDARDALIAKTGTIEEQQAAMERLNGVTEDAGDAQSKAAKKSDEFREALEKINDILPEIGKGLDDMKDKAELDAAFSSAARAAQTISELTGAVDAYNAALGRIDSKALDDALGAKGQSGSFAQIVAGVESGGNVNAKNPLSTATGLGQFIESTWLRLFREHFPTLAASRSEAAILQLRQQGDLSLKMIDLYAKENAAIMKQAGVATNRAALYLAHFLGPQGAIKVLSAGANDKVADLLSPGAIASNPGVLGGGRTAGDVVAWAERKVGISKEELEIQKELSELDQKKAEDAQKAAERTTERLTEGQQEVEQQRLINDGKAREAEIEKAIAEAKKENPAITAAQIEQIRQQTGALYDLKQVKKEDKAQEKEAEAVMQRINALLAQRVALQAQLKAAQQAGDTTKVTETETAIAEVNTQMDAAIAKAREMWAAIGGAAADTALIKLDTAAIKAANLATKAQQNFIDWSRVGQLFASGLASAFDKFAQAVANGEDVAEAAKTAFLEFASEFLRQIAQMIIQQAILNALQSFGFGGGGSGIGGAIAGIFHRGGVAGRAGSDRRRVNPAIFANAQRFHDGRIPGLAPSEMPAIIEKKEEILTEDDPRHILNGGLSSGAPAPVSLKNINMFDAPSFLEAALQSKIGEQAILNFISANPQAVNAALGAGR